MYLSLGGQTYNDEYVHTRVSLKFDRCIDEKSCAGVIFTMKSMALNQPLDDSHDQCEATGVTLGEDASLLDNFTLHFLPRMTNLRH